MAEDRVDVVFGARVGELPAGVAESKEAIEGLREFVKWTHRRPAKCGFQP
jgi:hypothetical protein